MMKISLLKLQIYKMFVLSQSANGRHNSFRYFNYCYKYITADTNLLAS